MEDHMDDSGFSAMCKDELDATIEDRIKNFELDTGMRDACEDDLLVRMLHCRR